MEKLVVIKLEGDFERDIKVTLEIGAEGARPDTEITGHLPTANDLSTYLANWQSIYRRLKLPSRAITDIKVFIDSTIRQQCYDAARELRDRLNIWLRSKSFLPIRDKWLEMLDKSDQVRVLIRTDNPQLQQLPWRQWDLLERYPLAEIGLSTGNFERPPKTTLTTDPGKVDILAILGDSNGIQIQKDRQILEALPHSRITFLVEPQRQELNHELWERPWDIIFFAGHSITENATGRIYINQTDSLTLDELREAFRKAIANGLQLAIFNSCDGWGLARNLATLNIPQMLIMKEPVPDQAAQQFLQDFLQAFASGQPLYQAVQDARKKLQGLEDKYPCASWLPVVCQNPAVVPPTWRELRQVNRSFYLPLLPASFANVAIGLLVLMLKQIGAPQVGQSREVIGSDFNGNGKVDILWQNTVTNQIEVWLMDGAGHLSNRQIGTLPRGFEIRAVGDFNGDDQDDLILQGPQGKVKAWFLKDAQRSGSETIFQYLYDAKEQIRGAADFDGDGRDDLLVHNVATGETEIWMMNGLDWREDVDLIPLQSSDWTIGGTADFNRDGHVDIFWHNPDTGQNQVWYLEGGAYIGSADLPNVTNANQTVAGVGDYNNDGNADVLWRNQDTGENAVWLMEGVQRIRSQSLPTRTNTHWQTDVSADLAQT